MPAKTAVLLSASKIAYTVELFRIKECVTALKGCEGLTALGRSWLAFYVALVREGYEQVKAPMGAITHAQSLAFGYTNSKSSAFRAHNELEKHGFIKRHTHRAGEDSKRSVIDIIIDRFTYWTQRPFNNVLPLPTNTYTAPRVSMRHTDYLTSYSPKLQTTDPDSLISNSYKSKSHANNKKPKTGFDSWVDPRLFTIGVVLKADSEPARKSIYKLASEILAGKVKNSPLDFDHWPTGKWQNMLHPEREHIARREFIPALKGAHKMPKPDQRVSKLIENAVSTLDVPKQLAYKLVKPPPPPEPPPLVQSLDDDDLAVLRAAQARLDYRKEREAEADKVEDTEHKALVERKNEEIACSDN